MRDLIDLNDKTDPLAMLIDMSLGSHEGTRNVYLTFKRLNIKAVEGFPSRKITLRQLTEEEAKRTNEAGLWFKKDEI